MAQALVNYRRTPFKAHAVVPKGTKTDKQQAIEALIGSVPFPPEYDDPTYDPDYELLRRAAYEDRGLL